MSANPLAQIEVDPVTGFGARRAMLTELQQAVANGRPCTLAIFSLDGLGELREQVGEEISNGVISRLGQEFGRFIEPDGICYAPRRHEFAAIFWLPWPKVEMILAAAAVAVRREASIFSITTSFGVAHLPADAQTPLAAVVVADERRVAAQKERRATSN